MAKTPRYGLSHNLDRVHLMDRLMHWNGRLEAHHEHPVVTVADADSLTDEELRRVVRQTINRALWLIETDNY